MENYAKNNSINLATYQEKEFKKHLFLVGTLSYEKRIISLKSFFRTIRIPVKDVISFSYEICPRNQSLSFKIFSNDVIIEIDYFENIYLSYLALNLLKCNVPQISSNEAHALKKKIKKNRK